MLVDVEIVQQHEGRRVHPLRGTDVLDGPVAEIAVDPQALQESENLEVAVHQLIQLDVGVDLRK